VATKCQAEELNEDKKKLKQVRATPQRAAIRRILAQRLVNKANKKGIERYMTPLDVVPIIPVSSWFPLKVQLLE
jgi:hypothetical protein